MIELFKPTELAGAIENESPAVGFFSQLFKFSEEFLHGTEEFLLDRVSGVTGVATYVKRDGEFVKVPSKGYKTNDYKPGYIKEEMTLTSRDLRDRDAGVPNLLGKQNPADKLPMKVGKQFAQLENRVQRALELQASQGLTTGKVQMQGYNDKNEVVVIYEVDFDLPAENKITPAILWSAATTAKPINDLEGAVQVINNHAATPGTNIGIFMSVDSFQTFKETTQVKESYNNRRFEYGKITPKMVNALGATYKGNVEGVGEIWTYSRQYKDAANADKNFMPDKTVLVVDLDSVFEEHYGVIENMDASSVGFKAKRLPMSYKQDKGQGIDNTLECAPLMAPLQLEGVVVLTVLA